MVSIRRTLSPSAHDHPSRRQIPYCYSPLSYSPPPSNPFRRILMAIPIRKSYRKWAHPPSPYPWRRSLRLLLLLCFLLGILLGFSPFSKTDDLDLSSRVPPPPPKILTNVVVITPEDIVSVELNTIKRDDPHPKLLIVITPTHNRALQAYYLTRLAHTLRLVPPPILWIVIESGRSASTETASLLRETGLTYRHLVCKDDSTDAKDRGVHQRNTALQHIKHHRLDGIVYFADDDNIYSLDLFRHLREIRRFGTWPVAMLAQSKNKAILEGPVCNGTRVIGWHTNEKSRRLRRFHVDMSGFAFNSTILWDPKRWNRSTSNAIRQLDTVKEGFQETTFIEQLVEDENQMEGLPHDCSRIMNWHLHLEARHLVYPEGWHVSRNLDVVRSELKSPA